MLTEVSIEARLVDEELADLVAVIEFPTEDSMHAFISDPEYAPYAKSRQAGTDSLLFGLDATDGAGTIPYLMEDS